MSDGWERPLDGDADRSATAPAAARAVVGDLRPGDAVALGVRPDGEDSGDGDGDECTDESEGGTRPTRVVGEVVDRACHHGILELRVAGAARYRVVRPAPTVETVTVRRLTTESDCDADPNADPNPNADADPTTVPPWDGAWTQLGRVVAAAVDTSERRSWPADPSPPPRTSEALGGDALAASDDRGGSAD
ncbi:MAG: hypothetical protein ABEJ79_09895 [Halolamina sp.]